MRVGEIRRLASLRRPRRPLERCAGVEDLRRLARRRTPRAVFDYVEGGADEELSLTRNVAAFRQWELLPLGPRDVSACDPSVQLLGRRAALPMLCSPTGYTRMMHPAAGELAVARAAARAGVPYGLSTVASTPVEDVAATGHPDLWFQLYVWRDRVMTRALVERAWAAGYRVLEVSIDAPVAGYRIRDVRNGLTIPPALTPSTLIGIALKPRYWIDVLRSPAIVFANSPPGVGTGGGITIENMTSMFDPSVTWDDIASLRSLWPGSLLVKGALSADSSREALAAGADGVHLSNHGGRQLDRIVPPIELVSEVRDAVGADATVIVDSGIRHGIDLAVAVALGADAGAVGRLYLYGLMAGGEAGVDLALSLLAAEFKRTMELLGVASVAELRAAGEQVLRRRPAVRTSRG
jgi:L-lactate dehydrogenase (cytochrome)